MKIMICGKRMVAEKLLKSMEREKQRECDAKRAVFTEFLTASPPHKQGILPIFSFHSEKKAIRSSYLMNQSLLSQ